MALTTFLPLRVEGASVVFTDRASFVAATGATSATGALPNLGAVGNTARLGSVILTAGPGAAGIHVGTTHPSVPNGDWSPRLPGPDIALDAREDLNIELMRPVTAIGINMVEPELDYNGSIPPLPFVDSTFELTLKYQGSVVDVITANVPNDSAAFVGITTTSPFNVVEIREVVGDIEDEYFGEILVAPHEFRLPFAGVYPISQGPSCPCPHCNHHGRQAEAIDYALDFRRVLAAEDGQVVFANTADGSNGCRQRPLRPSVRFGLTVEIEHPNREVSIYAHLSAVHVAVGQAIRKGQLIGISGNSTKCGSTGDTHLHFEVRSNTYRWPDGYRSNGHGVPITGLPGTRWNDPSDPCALGAAEGPPEVP